MTDTSKIEFDKIAEGLNQALATAKLQKAVADAALQKAIADLQAEIVLLKGELFRLSTLEPRVEALEAVGKD